MSFRPSKYILGSLGSVTLLLTASTTVFFTLYSISALSARSVIASSCTAAAVFNIATCVHLLLFTILPQRRQYLLGGIISTVLAVILSTLALGWMSFRPQDMPNIMFGRDRDPMVIAGFSLFVVSLVFQTIFWTLQVFTCPRSSDKSKEEGLESSPAEVAENPILPYDLTPTNLSSTTAGDKKYSSFVENVLHHTPNIYNSTVLYVTETPPVTEHAVEMDPFDAWDTSDVGATQRAACTLAVGLGIFKTVNSAVVVGDPGKSEIETNRTDEDIQIYVPVLERQNSPPIPDYDMTPRSTSFPAGIFGEHAPMTGSGRRPTLVVSPIGESREFDEGSGRLVPTRSPRGDLGTGKWLVRSQTMV